MEKKESDEFGSVESTHRLWIYFSNQVQILERARIRALQENAEIWSVITPLLYAIKDSCDSLSLLAQKGKTRDSFVLARTVYESIVNASFIFAKGFEAVERAKQHALQKSYRDTNRELEINSNKLGLEWSGTVDLSKNPDLQSALARYTSKKGREITAWTPETVKEQIEVIDSKYGAKVSTGLQFALMAIYRHASDIGHGTLFGALFSLGLTSPAGPPKSPIELEKHQRENISMLLMMLGLALESLIEILAGELTMPEITIEAHKETQKLKEETWVKANNAT